MSRRANRSRTTCLLRTAAVAACATAVAAPGASAAPPQTIDLPDGFQPEGIAAGKARGSAFVGSIPTGRIYALDVRTGRGAVRVKRPFSDSNAIGIEVDRNRIFVAGGMTGEAYVYDARTGRKLRRYRLPAKGVGEDGTFVNDVVVTRRAAYFTDSVIQQLYVLPLGPGGRLPKRGAVRRVPITGDLVYGEDFNANGIETTPDGRALITVQSSTGKLFRVNRRTGASREISLGPDTVVNGDGLLREGRRLNVVRNRDNRLSVVHLNAGATSGTVVRELSDPDFDVPTTVARVAGRLYAPNARFTTDPTPQTEYDVVRIGG